MSLASFSAQYGPKAAVSEPVKGFASKAEAAVYWELVRRIGRSAFIYQWSVGDIPYTPGREERSADFAILNLDLVILVNSAFTHPSPLEDQQAAGLFKLLGVETYFVWDYEVLPEMGGDVRATLDKIPGLRFYGQTSGEGTDSGSRQKRRYRQPPRDVSFFPVGGRRLARSGF